MNVIWRLLVAGLLLGGAVIWVPAMATAASTPTNVANPAVRGPLSQDNNEDNVDGDNDDGFDNDNDTGFDNDNDTGFDNDNDSFSDNNDGIDNDNASDNDNDAPPPAPTSTPVPNWSVPTDPNNTGAQVTNGELTIDLWRSTDRPVVNTPFQLGVTGSGAPIERVWLWAEAPGGNAGPANDDFALTGERSHECGGINPCDMSWNLIARNVGYYNIHAKVRDTSGREVQTTWYILFSENPR